MLTTSSQSQMWSTVTVSILQVKETEAQAKFGSSLLTRRWSDPLLLCTLHSGGAPTGALWSWVGLGRVAGGSDRGFSWDQHVVVRVWAGSAKCGIGGVGGQGLGSWSLGIKAVIPLPFERPERQGQLYRVGGTAPPSFLLCFGISLCPLFIYSSSQSPDYPQGHYRKFCPTSI